jgi:FtsP/CotA-like multicopper oxidase with cupredoxin domain
MAALSAATVEYDLTLARQEMNFTGHPVEAMTINGQLHGPTLRFTEGDRAVIRVHNQMDVETSVHWHGLLLPNAMDGVPFLTYPPIAPGQTFTYRFDLRQSGTYWYHSHTMLQEQRGLFGSLVIAPKFAGEFDGLRDHVVVLSDWTDEDASSVLHTLKRGSEWYSIRKGSGQSVLGAARLGLLGAYFSSELQRMPPMDLADVYYDRFLLNGAPQQSLAAKPGEKIRLRVIDGSASTFFYLQFAGGPMQVTAADGLPVQTFDEKRLLMGVAETYDVIVTVPSEGSHEFRATAHDGSGHASLWIGDGTRHAAPDIPFPNLYVNMGGLTLKRVLALTPGGSMGMPGSAVRAGKFDQPGMNGMSGMKEMDGMKGMEHGDMAPDAGKTNHSGMASTAPMSHAGHDMSGMAHGKMLMVADLKGHAEPGMVSDGVGVWLRPRRYRRCPCRSAAAPGVARWPVNPGAAVRTDSCAVDLDPAGDVVRAGVIDSSNVAVQQLEVEEVGLDGDDPAGAVSDGGEGGDADVGADVDHGPAGQVVEAVAVVGPDLPGDDLGSLVIGHSNRSSGPVVRDRVAVEGVGPGVGHGFAAHSWMLGWPLTSQRTTSSPAASMASRRESTENRA